jgi:hypothetical protein
MTFPMKQLTAATLTAFLISGICICSSMAADVKPQKASEKLPQLLIPSGVFDAEAGKINQGWVVLVTNQNIAAVGPRREVQSPPNIVNVELSETTLLPWVDGYSFPHISPPLQ